MTPQQLWAATGCRVQDAELFAAPITDAIEKWKVRKVANFIAQMAHESQLFTRLEENLYYTTAKRLCEMWPTRFPTEQSAIPYLRNPQALAERVYSGRMGNMLPGQGWLYRGRGLKHCTGLDNYTAYQTATGIEVINHPDLLLEPRFAADNAGWFWSSRRLDDYDDVRRITRIVQGGDGGLGARIALTGRAREVFA